MKISQEELEALSRIVMSDDWKVLLKYIKIIQENQQDELFTCENKQDVVYYSWAKNVGSKELLNEIEKLKEVIKRKIAE